MSACALLCCLLAADAPTARITAVRAGADSVAVHVDAPTDLEYALYELPCWAPDAPAGAAVARGRGPSELTVPRFDGPRDRLFSKFLVPGRPAWYVTDLSAVAARAFELPWPASIKGLQVQMVDDALALGVKHAGLNLLLNGVIDRSGRSAETVVVDGETFHINTDWLAGTDRAVKELTEAGVNVTAILLNGVPTAPDPDNPFIHPSTDLAGAPFHLGAFNLTDQRGYRAYRAAVSAVAERYSRPDRRFGWVSGYIIGNELQSHWEWYNIGRRPPGEVVEEYGRALRIADLAVRQQHAGLRVYVSMDHHWTAAIRPDRRTAIPGRTLLELIGRWSRERGDFPWAVAFHPYPENLFEPRFWNDATALPSFETPKITFRNLEVLPAFLNQEAYRHDGFLRRIILSEQGFHSPDGEDGETVQAAAYALAYHRLAHTPGVAAFILHRHVDHRQEFGLRLGLWTAKPEVDSPCEPDRRKRLWDVFRTIDTPGGLDAAAFALGVAGLTSWDQALPLPAARIDPGEAAPLGWRLIADLVFESPEVRDALDFRVSAVEHDGRRRLSWFHHPKEGLPTDATFTVDLPQQPPGLSLVLRLATALTGPSDDGVRFSVRVDGAERWHRDQRDQPAQPADIDLSAYAGRTVALTLRVEPNANISSDWANWVRPMVVIEPSSTPPEP